jgi:hypothetical protein
MILSEKFTQMVADSVNFVNFAGKRPCFQSRRHMTETGCSRRPASD